jgi:Terminase large subunit, T4likevirus-type, N-terminal
MKTPSCDGIVLRLRRPQRTVIGCEKRFRILVAGRRFGKTQVALIELIRAVCARDRIAWYVAPTNKQAKRIAWKRIKQLARLLGPIRIWETDLRIEFPWGATIAILGADNYDSLRGEGLDFVVLDEYASMAPEAWTEVLRPALADRHGRALFVGTPQGHNHFYELFDKAQNQSDWATFQYTTEDGGNVTAEELHAAAGEIDERTYRQEFQATFENQGVGNVYYAFDRQYNVRPLLYNPKLPVFWAMDFNVGTLCSVVGQIVNGKVCVLDELILTDSHTPDACAEFLSRTEKWVTVPEIFDPPESEELREVYDEILRQLQPAPMNVYVYGDATAQRRQTSAHRTDWQIVKDFFGRHSDLYHVGFRVLSSNPPVKDRTNCVNAMLRNHAGQHRLFMDPKCKQLIRDFEQVCWKADPNGNQLADLDGSDPMRTHASDALGYMIAREFPMQPKFGERSGPSLL